MAAAPMAAMHLCCSKLSSSLTCCHRRPSSRRTSNNSQKLTELFTTRRSATAFLTLEFFSKPSIAAAFELRFTVPDQTVEEAEAAIKSHAQGLLEIKPLLDLQSWKDAQTALRESSAFLKQDLFTVIQAKPGSQRPLLRKLYSDLFNSVSKLDYAARNKDASVVEECYDNIVATLTEIFAKL